MVASGVASKGLDFNDIQHVIIFSMPKEIEDYVHQIGRTGRSGKTGIATTFVNMNTPEQTLLDLKYLLMEAGQKYVVSLLVPFALIYTISNGLADQGADVRLRQGTTVLGEHRRSARGPGWCAQRLSCLWRSRTRYLQLPEAGGHTAEANGLAQNLRRQRLLSIPPLSPLRFSSVLVAHIVQACSSSTLYVYMIQQRYSFP